MLHCWKILLILVLGKVASKTQYSHSVICKVWALGFTHHFTLHPLIWQIFSLISWLYFSTMWILWGRKCDYWVFHITHAKKGLPNHSSSTRDLKDFFSICDVENTILTYPPHSILSMFFLKYKTETGKTVQRQLHILHNISKFRHFITYQITFLMTSQLHKSLISQKDCHKWFGTDINSQKIHNLVRPGCEQPPFDLLNVHQQHARWLPACPTCFGHLKSH